jgi:hypothetical protein
VLAATEVTRDPQGHTLAVDRDHGVIAHGLAGATEILDRLARASPPGLVVQFQ